MSRTSSCAWCKQEVQKASYPDEQSFSLSFEVGTNSDLSGPNLEGYEIGTMCTGCAWKLKGELEKLGIELVEVET